MLSNRWAGLVIGLLCLGVASGTALAQSKTLEQVRARGSVRCGTSTGFPGFALPDSKGIYQGIDADVCRAVAAATLGDASKVQYVPLSGSTRFTALQSGEVDLLARNTTWTYTRSAQLGLVFTAVNYYDGQGFMVPLSEKVAHVGELKGASVCVLAGTDTQAGLQDYFSRHGMKFEAVTFETIEQMKNAFGGGAVQRDDERHDVVGGDPVAVGAARRLRAAAGDRDEGAAVAGGAGRGRAVGGYRAVELVGDDDGGGAGADVGEYTGAGGEQPGPERAAPVWQGRGAGPNAGAGPRVGVDDRAAGRELRGEFRAQPGPLGVERGLNRLWRDGGLLYAPPLR